MPFKLSGKQIVWGMIILYIAVFGTLTALRHYNFETQTWDLAAFVQSFWNAAHGRGLTNTLEQVPNHLGLHMSPFLFLLVPGYVIFPSAYYLLFIQTVALALGAWPLYLLAKKVLGNILLSRVIAVAYLLYPGLHWANMYDFHEITFFVPLMLAALYFIEEQKWPWAAVFLALAAGVKEDAILVVLFAGAYLLVKRLPTNRKFGIGVGVVAILYFLLAIKVLMPALGGGVLRFDRYANLGESPAAIVKNIAANPLILAKTVFTSEKAAYVFWLFLPVAFLPFLSWRPLLLIIPGLAENLLTNYQFQFSGLYHYDAILIPGMFLGVIYGVKAFLEKWPEKEQVFLWVFLGAILTGFIFRSPIKPASFPLHYFESTAQETAYRNMLKLAPPNASVAAHTNLVPHLANRATIHQLGLESELAEVVLIDGNDSFGFEKSGDFQKYVDNYLKLGNHEAHAFEGRYLVLLNKKYRLIPQTK